MPKSLTIGTMFDQGQNQITNQNGKGKISLSLLILILGILSVASIGILALATLQQIYPKVFAAPGINKELNYQGKLQDASGITVPDGTYAMKFTIYDSAAGGTALWSAKETDACGGTISPDTKSVGVSKGVFSTLLGETGDCPILLDFNDDAYYLGVTVGLIDSEMTPRKRIGAAGYAFNADLVDGLNTSNAGGANAYVPVTDGSGNLILSKNFTVDTNAFFVNSTNNRVGINNGAPVYTLDVTSSEVGGAAVYGQATDATGTANYGGYFNAAGTGAGTSGVWGRATGAGIVYGVRGNATSTSAVTNYGGYFQANGTNGGTSGVYGAAIGAGPALENYGGRFTAAGDWGRGVYGTATNGGAAANYGGYFIAEGTAGAAGVYGQATGGGTVYGVYGDANSTGAVTNYGGYFKAQGQTGRGVYGEATYNTTSTINYGGYFKAAGTAWGTSGVYGEASGAGNTVYGVYGEASSTAAVSTFGGYFVTKATGLGSSGVYGEASNSGAIRNHGGVFAAQGTGVQTSGVWGRADGAASDIYGVHGAAGNTGAYTNYGGYFTAQGQTGRGVYGEASNSGAFQNFGGYFTAAGQSGVGVSGMANATGAVSNIGGNFEATGDWGYGVKGEATATGATAINIGGYFQAEGDTGYGVSGRATALTGTNYGGYFRADGDTGRAVYGIASNAAASANYGGYFQAQGTGGAYGVYANASGATGINYGVFSSVTSSSGWSGYFTGGQGVKVVGNIVNVIDSSSPLSPILKGSISTGGGSSPINLFVSGRYTYVLNYGAATMSIIDVSDPSTPVLISSTATNSNPRFIHVSDNYAYIVNDSLTSTLQIFDISNPTSPISVSSTATNSDPKSIEVSGHYAYIVNTGGNTLQVFDVSDPASPNSISSTATSVGPFYIDVSGKYAYIVEYAPVNTLEIYDISDPAAPSFVGSTPTGSDPRAVRVSGSYAYVAAMGVNVLEIYDISNPALPSFVSSAFASSPYNLYISGRYVFTVGEFSPGRLRIFDVLNPATLAEVGNVSTSSSPTSVHVSGRYAYIANAGGDNLEIYDISGLETTSAMIHSLEAGDLQVRDNTIVQGQMQVGGGISAGGTGFFGQGISAFRATSTVGMNNAGYFQADGPVDSAVFARVTDITGVNYAVTAETSSPTGYGVYAYNLSSSGLGYGVWGGVNSPDGYGVKGETGSGTGIGRGVYGVTHAAGGYGVYGSSDNATGGSYAVYGTTVIASDWAGYFTGGMGLYAARLAVADLSSVAYNTIGLAGASHTAVGEIEDTSDLYIADDLEIDGYTWLDGGYTDLAEMIAYSGQGEAGDVIVIDENMDNTAKLSTKPYDSNVIGIISEKPSLIITGGIKEGKLLAVAGRIPTKVTNTNGSIKRGDLLTTSSKPGFAMKATEAGPTVGKALEPCNQDSCTIWVFLNVGWYGSTGVATSSFATTTPVEPSGFVVSSKLTEDLDANGFAINNVSRITSKDEIWSIDENGILKTKIAVENSGEYDPSRDPAAPKYKEIFGLSSTQVEVVLSGSAKLDKGEALVDFAVVDSEFAGIIDQEVPLRISVTPTESCGGLYVEEKYAQGFKVKELNDGKSSAAFDWIVIGKRKQ